MQRFDLNSAGPNYHRNFLNCGMICHLCYEIIYERQDGTIHTRFHSWAEECDSVKEGKVLTEKEMAEARTAIEENESIILVYEACHVDD